jgi:hypothetical protein
VARPGQDDPVGSEGQDGVHAQGAQSRPTGRSDDQHDLATTSGNGLDAAERGSPSQAERPGDS